MQLSTSAAFVIQRLESQGFRAWAVGGCVRDSLRQMHPHDFDIATTALPAQTLASFADCTVVETGLQHGTVTVVVDGEPVEVTTLRTEQGYSDGRRPDGVTFVDNLSADLARRDFTINAMAWHPATGLNDPYGGKKDLQEGVLRCVGDPDSRFAEDSLRILRGLRFASCLSFSIHPATAAAMERLAPALKRVSAERVWAELQRLLEGPATAAVLAAHFNILEVILPEIILDSQQIRQLLPILPPLAVVRLAALLGPGREAPAAVAKRLKTDRATRRQLSALCGRLPDWWPQPASQAAAWLERLWRCHTTAQLAVGGSDLHRVLGIAPGPAMGRLLALLLDAVVAGDCPNQSNELLEFAQKMWYNS